MNFFSWYSGPQVKFNSAISILGNDLILEKQEDLIEIVSHLIWLSYRTGFGAIGNSSYVSDAGWGCMLRTGQMILAQTLLKCYLGSDASNWKNADEFYLNQIYNNILCYFNDTSDAPFSLHKIAMIGESELKKPVGQWFGPSTISSVLKKIFEDLTQTQTQFPLRIFLCAPYPVIPKVEVISACTKTGSWQPVLLLIPSALGINKVSPCYIESLKAYLQLRQSVGFLGGAPNNSYYFYGFQGDNVLYLDPHTTQPFSYVSAFSRKEELTSYFTQSILLMDISKIDVSIAFGFYCGTEHDFLDLIEKIDLLHAQENFNGLFSVETVVNELTLSTTSNSWSFLDRSLSTDSFSSSFAPFTNSNPVDELKPVYKSNANIIDEYQGSPSMFKHDNGDDNVEASDEFEKLSFVLMESGISSSVSPDVEILTTIRKKQRDGNSLEHQDDFDFDGNVSEFPMMSSQQFQADVIFDK